MTILATGGTISTTRGNDGRTAPTLSGREVSALTAVPGVTLVSRDLVRRPSWALEPAELAGIALTARDEARAGSADASGPAGVVVTHGTTTLEYTAFLADLVLDVDTPVVLTGAMRRADDPAADGPANLRDAVAVAASEEARGLGALVVFAGHIIAARRAWKAHRTGTDAFVDLGGDIGRVDQAGVRIERAPGRGPCFSGRLDERVAFVKAVPGMDGRIVETALATGVHGLVVEALPGAGGIPPRMQPSVAAAAGAIPTVVASRAPYGRLADVPGGGTGDPLRELDLLSAGSLTAEQAWLLLMAALGDAEDDEDARARFRAAATGITEADSEVKA
ncbi:MAG TPA: asparaginase [Candidatus Limnocylindrales bacterium]|nr:asparaginase [Candidatus Limnocylindrales bacterium]